MFIKNVNGDNQKPILNLAQLSTSNERQYIVFLRILPVDTACLWI